jgi:hypothetical protein
MPEEKLVFMKSFKDESCDATMLFNGFCENEDVIEVETDDTFHDEVLENVVHYGLEGGGGVSESKKHHQGFKEAMVCPNTAFHLLPSFMHMLLYPHHMLSFMKYFMP